MIVEGRCSRSVCNSHSFVGSHSEPFHLLGLTHHLPDRHLVAMYETQMTKQKECVKLVCCWLKSLWSETEHFCLHPIPFQKVRPEWKSGGDMMCTREEGVAEVWLLATSVCHPIISLALTRTNFLFVFRVSLGVLWMGNRTLNNISFHYFLITYQNQVMQVLFPQVFDLFSSPNSGF